MKAFLTLSIIGILCFSCSKATLETKPRPVNSAEVNLAIGIEEETDLSLVLNTLNDLNCDIRQMNGFFYNSNTPENGVIGLINILNEDLYK